MSNQFPPDRFLEMPPDPFAEDPSDPVAAFDGCELVDPLSDAERAAIIDDLASLSIFEVLLTPRGIRGIVVPYGESQQDCYHDWHILRANLQHLLSTGSVLHHEPAYAPDSKNYVTWDYCRGYADAVLGEEE